MVVVKSQRTVRLRQGQIGMLPMDFLRVRDVDQADPRYGSLTPAQWMCVALFLFGLFMLRKVRQIKASGQDPQDMVALSGGAPPLASRASPDVTGPA